MEMSLSSIAFLLLSSASSTTLSKASLSKFGRLSKGYGFFLKRPGAVSVAIRAASTAIVPEPQKGS